jgi:DNA-binding transcriptional MerR regulator
MERIAQGRANHPGANATAPTKGEAMSRISSLNHPSVGTSAALLGGEGRSASDSAQSEMTISQMSRLFGVSLRTLRFYEDRGLIKPRREGNARFYRGADRVRMEMILKGKKLGFTLTEIQDLIGGKGATETPDLEDQLNAQQIVTQIGHLERQRGEIDSAIERLRATQSRLAQGAAA